MVFISSLKKGSISIKGRGFSPDQKVVFDLAADVATKQRGCKVKVFFANGRTQEFDAEIVSRPELNTGERCRVVAVDKLSAHSAVEQLVDAMVSLVDHYG